MFGTRFLLAATALIMALCLLPAQAEPLFKGSEAIPADAVILFDGKSLSSWVYTDGDKPANWRVEDGYMEVRGGNIRTKADFADCQLHMEFWLPLMADSKGQGRANSGVFLQGAYEIQVLDSYGLKSEVGDCGAIYSTHPPMVNACRPPENWQTYDIFFRAARFDADGKKTENARISALQNGVWIHNCADVPSPTADRSAPSPQKPGPIVLQDHGCLIRYRNVWVRPLGDATAKP